ncbi:MULTISPECIES: alpha/beta hydrolase family protein [Streptomycetaceae]|uniref:alpha/beta hydrolase family protein n=1 Tax=Streptomycetaceae TaxID=2062 RepID=UPI0009662986|nr:alpha/beta fold hydrolase [Streptomyces sp. CB02056]OKI06456.1 hydrolase [Streptomyces sp. CB02056]
MKMFGRRRWLWGSLLSVAVLLAGMGGWVVYQNEYDLTEERVTVTGGRQPLQGVLARPTGGHGPYGLVVFVHGDGPVDATHDTFYRPLWEAMAKAGYATLSWDKPGVNNAPGDWLDQSMQDRVDETLAAIRWAKAQPGIDPNRIGLWGASQAGWVMPKAARQSPDVRFVIAVGTAVNWLQQGRYNLLAELGERHASPAETAAAVARSDRNLAALRAGSTFEEYRAAGGDVDGLTPERWAFNKRNHLSDATEDLAALRVPVQLVLGGRDVNVDSDDTEAAYRRLVTTPGLLHVLRFPDSTHNMVPKDVEDSELRSTFLAVAAPRSLFTPGYLDGMRNFLSSLDPASPDHPKG